MCTRICGRALSRLFTDKRHKPVVDLIQARSLYSTTRSLMHFDYTGIKIPAYCYSTFQSPSVLQQSMDYQHFRQDALAIFKSSVDAVYPPQMIRNSLHLSDDGSQLIVDGREYPLNKNVHVAGFGKAVLGMARAVEDLLGGHLVSGVLSVPVGSQELFTSIGKQDLCLREGSKIKVYEGAHNNMPDESAHTAAISIQKLIQSLTADDILIVLISGGGSALLPCPEPPITLQEELEMTRILSQNGGGSALLPCPEPPISLQEELEMTRILSQNGATIQQLNILRQNIETLKGGGLAKLSYPAPTISLILSDVIDDKLDIISSGPTVPLLSSPRQCLQILDSLHVQDKIPNVILSTLKTKAEEKKAAQETRSSLDLQKYSSGCDHVHNVIIGSNKIATDAAFTRVEQLNYVPVVLTNSLQGEARNVADMFVNLAKFVILGYGFMPANQGNEELTVTELDLVKFGISKSDVKRVDTAATKSYNSEKGLCIICGGETTVTVRGKGKGGRNQEMALAFALSWSKYLSNGDKKLLSKFHVEFLSAGTDGQDGPTEAAGAVVNENLVPMAISSKMNPEKYLDNNDSYNLFKSLKNSDCLIECGLTGTNVMDVQLLLVKYLSD